MGYTCLFNYLHNGFTWVEVNNGILQFEDYIIAELAASGNYLFAVTEGSYVYRSGNGGSSWSAVNGGNSLGSPATSIAINGNNIFVGTDGSGVFLSTDNGNTFAPVNNGLTLDIKDIAINGSTIYAISGSTLYVTTNNGSTWTYVNGCCGASLFSLEVNGSNIYVGGLQKFNISNDNGLNWFYNHTGINNGYTEKNISSIAFSGNYVFAGAHHTTGMLNDGGVYISADNGHTWERVSAGLGNYPDVTALIVRGDYIYAGIENEYSTYKRLLSEMIPQPNCGASFTLYPDVNTQHLWYTIATVTGTQPITYSWDWGDGNVSSGSNPSHTYNTPGYYNVCLTITDANGCTANYCSNSTYIYKTDAEIITINVVDVLPTGLTELNQQIIKIYPNPATTEITISGYSPEYLKLNNTLGQTVAEAKKINKLNVGNLSQGLYVLQLFDEKGGLVKTEKVVKE